MNNQTTNLLAGLLALIPALAMGQQTDTTRLAELERKVDALTRELEEKQVGDLFQEVGDSAHGLAPAASKVYFAPERTLSLGGYGEAVYYNYDGEKASEADMYRAILYTGFKYNDKLVLNTEMEFEHGTTGSEGEVSVEFAYIDYLHAPELNLRAGLVLVPMGLVNEIHEPTTFFSVRRPDVENRIIPTTWREMGVGAHGELGRVSYSAYLLNGLRADGFSPKGIRDGRQKGSKAQAEDFAGVLRIDIEAADGFTIGGSGYLGDSGQTLNPAVGTQILEAHAELRQGGLTVRALAVAAEVDDAAELSRIIANKDTETPVADGDIDPVGERMTGWYAEAGFDVMTLVDDAGTLGVIPFVRFEQYNTQDKVPDGFKAVKGGNDIEVITAGINIKPVDEVVLKADMQFYDSGDGKAVDQFNLGLGYVF